MLWKQIKNPEPWKFKRISLKFLILLILTFPIWIWFWIYFNIKYFYKAVDFTNNFQRFGKYDPLYRGTEKYSIDVLKRDSVLKKNLKLSFNKDELENLNYEEIEIPNNHITHSVLVIKNPNNNDDKWVIGLHGWTENKFLALRLVKHFYKAGYNILTYDSRGHGKSSNYPITLGYEEKHDLANIIKYMHKHFSISSIGLIGNSMGGSTIIEFIKNYNTSLENFKIVWAINDCGFSNLKEQLRWASFTIFQKHWFWTTYAIKKSFKIINRFSINKVNCKKQLNLCSETPLLIIHGAKDSIVPLYMASEIYKNKIHYEKIKKSKLLIINDAEHVQCISTDYELYTKETLEFAKRHETKIITSAKLN